MKTLADITRAVDSGETVHWKNPAYTVIRDKRGQYLVGYDIGGRGENYAGLFYTDGVRSDYKAGDFFRGRGKNPNSTVAGQTRLAYRGSRIASLLALNEQLRRLDPTEAWHPDNIKDASDSELDVLQDKISALLVSTQRAKNPKAPKMKTITLTHENYNYLARDLHVLAHAPAEQVQTKSGPRWKVKVTAAKAVDVKEALKAKPKNTRLMKMGAGMRERHPGYADNPLPKADREREFDLARQNLFVWKEKQKEWSRVFNAAFEAANGRKADIGDVNISGIGSQSISYDAKAKLRDINKSMNNALDLAYAHYKRSGKRNFIKFKETETPAMKRAKNPAKPGRIESEKDMRMLARQAVARSEADGTSVARNALGIVEDYRAAGHIIGAMEAAIIAEMAGDYMGAKNAKRRTGRERNPVSRATWGKPKKTKLILVLIGHPDGKGYYTGKGWDTVEHFARGFTSQDGAMAVGKKLSAGLPPGHRIELHLVDKD